MRVEREREVEVRGSPTRCPFCHEGCTADDDNVVCRDCLARHHAPCWAEAGRCGACSSERPMEASALASATVPTPSSRERVMAELAVILVGVAAIAMMLLTTLGPREPLPAVVVGTTGIACRLVGRRSWALVVPALLLFASVTSAAATRPFASRGELATLVVVALASVPLGLTIAAHSKGKA